MIASEMWSRSSHDCMACATCYEVLILFMHIHQDKNMHIEYISQVEEEHMLRKINLDTVITKLLCQQLAVIFFSGGGVRVGWVGGRMEVGDSVNPTL